MSILTRPKRLPGRDREGATQPQRTGRFSLAVIQVFTGVTGLAGGVLLIARPDGSLLRATPDVLAGTPFTDWRVPGVLLAVLVGGGFLLTGWWTWRDYRYGRALSVFAGTGLIAFEAAELGWLGFQPLEAIFAVVGLVTVVLALRVPASSGALFPSRSRGDNAR